MNDLALKNEQQVETIARGQTSDQYIIPEDYEWKLNRDSFANFFTYDDFMYMLSFGQEKFDEAISAIDESEETIGPGILFDSLSRNLEGRCWLRIYVAVSSNYYWDSKKGECLIYPEPTFRLSVSSEHRRYSKVSDYSKSKLLEMGYEAFLKILMSFCDLYDFSGDLSIVPVGVNEMFAYTLEKIDKEKDNIQSSFIWLSVYLNDLVNVYDKSNILAYGCKYIYDFAEKRFGFGRTSVKNFLAIYDKFIDGATVKPAFKDYSYSQLTELVSVPSWKLADFSADMTVKEIREKKKDMSKSAEKSEAESTESSSVHAETVKTYERKLDESSVLKTILKMPNPYFMPDKEKQSARYDAYEKALNDVLEVLNRRLGCTREFRGEE